MAKTHQQYPEDDLTIAKKLDLISRGDWWDEAASVLQRMGINSEHKEPQLYTHEEVSQAIVHGRHDIVLVVSHASSINKQINKTNAILNRVSFFLLLIFIVEATRLIMSLRK